MANQHTPSRLDANQVLQNAFDDDSQRLRVDTAATVVDADIDITLDAADDSVSIADQTTGNKLKINSDGSVNVSSQGSATETKQDVTNVFLGNINQGINNIPSPFAPPKDCDSMIVNKDQPTIDIIYYKKNGANGIILKTVRVTYVDAAKLDVIAVELL